MKASTFFNCFSYRLLVFNVLKVFSMLGKLKIFLQIKKIYLLIAGAKREKSAINTVIVKLLDFTKRSNKAANLPQSFLQDYHKLRSIIT